MQVLMLLLALICCTTMLSSCKKKDESGKINKVEVSSEKNNDIEKKNTFTELDIPYDYAVKSVQSGMAYSTMKVPKSYDVVADNARHFSFSAPIDDTHVHGATFHLLYDFSSYGFGLDGDGSSKDKSDSSTAADTYVDKFSWELPSLTYTVDGESYNLRSQELGDSIVNGADFTTSKNDVTCTVANDIDLLTSTMDYGPENYSQVTYYYNWQDIPCCMSAVVRNDDVSAAKKIMEYMISSSKYQASHFDTRKTYKLRDCTLSLPNGLEEPKNSSSNILYFPVDRTKDAMAGITVGVFAIDTKETDALSEKTMNSTYGNMIGENLSPGGGSYSYYVSTEKVSSSPSTMAGKKANHYTSIVSMDGQGGNENNALAGTFYGDPANCCIDTLVIKDGTTQHILSVWYQSVQKKSAMNILSIAASSIDFE